MTQINGRQVHTRLTQNISQVCKIQRDICIFMYGMARWDRVLRHRMKYGDVLCKQRNSLICMMLRSTRKAGTWFSQTR